MNFFVIGYRRGIFFFLEVKYKYGFCFLFGFLNLDKFSYLIYTEIFEYDEERVELIRDRVRVSSKLLQVDRVRQKKDIGFFIKSGSIIGSGNFIVTVGFGIFKKDFFFIFDIGNFND